MTPSRPALVLLIAIVAAGCQKPTPPAPTASTAPTPGRAQPTPPAATPPAAKEPTLFLTPAAFAEAAKIPPDVVDAWKKANALPEWFGFDPKYRDHRTNLDRGALTDPMPCFGLGSLRGSEFRAGALETLPSPPVPFALSATNLNHTDATLRGIGKHKTLAQLALHWAKITDKTLEEVATLPDLKVLSLSQNDTGDAGLKHVGRLTTLTTLYVTSIRATDAGLAHLKGLTNLTSLVLWGNPLERPGPVLAELPRLQVLRLEIKGPPGDTLRALGNLKELRELHLSFDRPNPQDDALAGVKDLKSVERLTLSTPVSAGDVEHFKGLTGLKTLRLGDWRSATGLKDAFQKALPNCEVLIGL